MLSADKFPEYLALFKCNTGSYNSHDNVCTQKWNRFFLLSGFVAAKDEGLVGTYGFLDQIEALKWVKSNIDEFGGNSNMITIHGHSAGAANVGFLSTSPMSKGVWNVYVV